MFLRAASKTYIVAEIGINHEGSLDKAMRMIRLAAEAGADAVKFQKRTPRMVVPPSEWDAIRDTPWGPMTKVAYRERVEFGGLEYEELIRYANENGVELFASAWDCNAADTLYCLDMPVFKIPSAKLTDLALVEHIAKFHLPVIASTGMSTKKDIDAAMKLLYPNCPEIALLVCTAEYPAQVSNLHLNRIREMQWAYPDVTIGYSGHELETGPSIAAVALGAQVIERHVTLDRNMKGSDQSSSLTFPEFARMVGMIRDVEAAMGQAHIGPRACEAKAFARLR